MTRREFTAFSVAAPLAAAEGPRQWPVSIFTKHLQWLSISDAAAFAKELGFDAIDLTVRKNGHIEPENVAAELPKAVDSARKSGVRVSMITTAIMSAEEPDTPAIVKAAGVAGITHYRWGGIKYTAESPKEYIARLRPQFARLADLNAKHNVCGIYHTHSGINEFGASIWDLCETLDGVDPKALGINYDIGHATVEGGFGGWINSLRRSGPYVRGVAVKDFLWKKDAKGAWRPEWTPLGEGMVNLQGFFKRLSTTSFDGPLQLHCEYPMGGADHGNPKITWTRDQVAQAMRRDLEVLRTAMKS
jgi:sugar phosphate isomerase/epimerase